MTNEEAIEVFKNDIEICTVQQEQACDMAIKVLEQQPTTKNVLNQLKDEILELVKSKLNERKMSIPISETYTEDHKVGWRDGIFWSDVLEIFEELEGEK